jgi:hypothetical protein
MWEDEANINGGKWIVRLKKGVAARYWEEIVREHLRSVLLPDRRRACCATHAFVLFLHLESKATQGFPWRNPPRASCCSVTAPARRLAR